MLDLPRSLWEWLFDNGYSYEAVLISFGHTEYLTDEMLNAYYKWLKTDEAKPFLEMDGENGETDA